MGRFRHKAGVVQTALPTTEESGAGMVNPGSRQLFLQMNYRSIRLSHKWLKRFVWTAQRGYFSRQTLRNWRLTANTRATCKKLYHSVAYWYPIVLREIVRRSMPGVLGDMVWEFLGLG
jgi:hypothetical protein